MRNQYMYMTVFVILLAGCTRKQVVNRDHEASDNEIQIRLLRDSLTTYKNSNDTLKKIIANSIRVRNIIRANRDSLHRDSLITELTIRALRFDAALAMSVPTKPKFTTIKIHYATDRNTLTLVDSSKVTYGTERAKVSYGTCYVTVPSSHEVGDVETPMSILGIKFAEDLEKHIVLGKVYQDTKINFFLDLSKRINKSPNKSAFIFIHGYNVSFEDAAKHTAQICYDLKFSGVPMFYSWPSKNNTLLYTTDEVNIEWTQSHLELFLKDFFNTTKAENVYIIGHSMGNRAISKAICSVSNTIPSFKEKVKEVILAAPDIDADTFKENIAPILKNSCKRVTVYGSASDIAILMSKQFHGYKRLGDTFQGANTIAGIDFIDATGVDTSLLGHSYFSARSILVDIYNIISQNKGPAGRFGLNRVDANPVPYWKFAP